MKGREKESEWESKGEKGMTESESIGDGRREGGPRANG